MIGVKNPPLILQLLCDVVDFLFRRKGVRIVATLLSDHAINFHPLLFFFKAEPFVAKQNEEQDSAAFRSRPDFSHQMS